MTSWYVPASSVIVVVAAGLVFAVVSAVARVSGSLALRARGPMAPDELDELDDELLEDDELDELEEEDELLDELEDELLLEEDDELEELLEEELEELEPLDDEDEEELEEDDDEELELLEDEDDELLLLDDDAAVTVSEPALLRVKPKSLVTVTVYAPASAAWAFVIVKVALVPPSTGVL